MKIRNSFVSNSSSSSYIVCKPNEIDLSKFCMDIVNGCMNKKYEWINDKEYKIVTLSDNNHTNKQYESECLEKVLNEKQVHLALPIYMKFVGWYKILGLPDVDYYNYEEGSDMFLGGQIPLEMIDEHIKKAEDVLSKYDDVMLDWINDIDPDNYWKYQQIDEFKKEDLINDIEWLKNLKDLIVNKKCKLYGMKMSTGGDGGTDEGFYAFNCVSPKNIENKYRPDLEIVVASETW